MGFRVSIFGKPSVDESCIGFREYGPDPGLVFVVAGLTARCGIAEKPLPKPELVEGCCGSARRDRSI